MTRRNDADTEEDTGARSHRPPTEESQELRVRKGSLVIPEWVSRWIGPGIFAFVVGGSSGIGAFRVADGGADHGKREVAARNVEVGAQVDVVTAAWRADHSARLHAVEESLRRLSESLPKIEVGVAVLNDQVSALRGDVRDIRGWSPGRRSSETALPNTMPPSGATARE